LQKTGSNFQKSNRRRMTETWYMLPYVMLPSKWYVMLPSKWFQTRKTELW